MASTLAVISALGRSAAAGWGHQRILFLLAVCLAGQPSHAQLRFSKYSDGIQRDRWTQPEAIPQSSSFLDRFFSDFGWDSPDLGGFGGSGWGLKEPQKMPTSVDQEQSGPVVESKRPVPASTTTVRQERYLPDSPYAGEQQTGGRQQYKGREIGGRYEQPGRRRIDNYEDDRRFRPALAGTPSQGSPLRSQIESSGRRTRLRYESQQLNRKQEQYQEVVEEPQEQGPLEAQYPTRGRLAYQEIRGRPEQRPGDETEAERPPSPEATRPAKQEVVRPSNSARNRVRVQEGRLSESDSRYAEPRPTSAMELAEIASTRPAREKLSRFYGRQDGAGAGGYQRDRDDYYDLGDATASRTELPSVRQGLLQQQSPPSPVASSTPGSDHPGPLSFGGIFGGFSGDDSTTELATGVTSSRGRPVVELGTQRSSASSSSSPIGESRSDYVTSTWEDFKIENGWDDSRQRASQSSSYLGEAARQEEDTGMTERIMIKPRRWNEAKSDYADEVEEQKRPVVLRPIKIKRRPFVSDQETLTRPSYTASRRMDSDDNDGQRRRNELSGVGKSKENEKSNDGSRSKYAFKTKRPAFSDSMLLATRAPPAVEAKPVTEDSPLAPGGVLPPVLDSKAIDNLANSPVPTAYLARPPLPATFDPYLSDGMSLSDTDDIGNIDFMQPAPDQNLQDDDAEEDFARPSSDSTFEFDSFGEPQPGGINPPDSRFRSSSDFGGMLGLFGQLAEVDRESDFLDQEPRDPLEVLPEATKEGPGSGTYGPFYDITIPDKKSEEESSSLSTSASIIASSTDGQGSKIFLPTVKSVSDLTSETEQSLNMAEELDFINNDKADLLRDEPTMQSLDKVEADPDLDDIVAEKEEDFFAGAYDDLSEKFVEEPNIDVEDQLPLEDDLSPPAEGQRVRVNRFSLATTEAGLSHSDAMLPTFSTTPIPVTPMSDLSDENEYAKTHIRLQKIRARVSEGKKKAAKTAKTESPLTTAATIDGPDENRYSKTHIAQLKTIKSEKKPDYDEFQVKDVLKVIPVSKLNKILKKSGFGVSDLFKKDPEAIDIVTKAMKNLDALDEEVEEDSQGGRSRSDDSQKPSSPIEPEEEEVAKPTIGKKIAMPWPKRKESYEPTKERENSSRRYGSSQRKESLNTPKKESAKPSKDDKFEEEVASMDVKSLMKKISPMSLSEVLQEVGFSLPDVMTGNKNAIRAVLRYHQDKTQVDIAEDEVIDEAEIDPQLDQNLEDEFDSNREVEAEDFDEFEEAEITSPPTSTTTTSSNKRIKSSVDLFKKFKKTFRPFATTEKSTTAKSEYAFTPDNDRFGERTTKRKYESRYKPSLPEDVVEEDSDEEDDSLETEDRLFDKEGSYVKPRLSFGFEPTERSDRPNRKRGKSQRKPEAPILFKDLYKEGDDGEELDDEFNVEEDSTEVDLMIPLDTTMDTAVETTTVDDVLNITLADLNITVDVLKERQDELSVPGLEKIFQGVETQENIETEEEEESGKEDEEVSDIVYGIKKTNGKEEKPSEKRKQFIQTDFGGGSGNFRKNNMMWGGFGGAGGMGGYLGGYVGGGGMVTDRRTTKPPRRTPSYGPMQDLNGDLLENNLDSESHLDNQLLGDYKMFDYFNPYEDYRYDMQNNPYEDYKYDSGEVPEGVKSALIASSVVGGFAVSVFLCIFMFCLWKQMKSKLRLAADFEEDKTSGSFLSELLYGKARGRSKSIKEPQGYFSKVTSSPENNYSTTSSDEY